MKHWSIYLIIAGAIILGGMSTLFGTDIAQLNPVEAVWIQREETQIYLETDTGEFGRGADIQSALADMKKSAARVVFLETADYLIVQDEKLLEELYNVLRPSCMVCRAEKKPNMEEAAAFLNAHEPTVTLQQHRARKMQLPVLLEKGKRFEWFEVYGVGAPVDGVDKHGSDGTNLVPSWSN